MSLDPAVHLHELRRAARGAELGSIHRREAVGREVLGFFYPPGGAGLGEAVLVAFLQSVQQGTMPPCPGRGGGVHEGCLVQDIQTLNPRRDRKRRRTTS